MLSDIKKIHIIGIKGTGMAGLALLLHQLGFDVQGSDKKDSFYPIDSKQFTKRKIKVFSDFAAKNVNKKIDLAIATHGYNTTKNPEVKALKNLGISVLDAEKAIGELTNVFPTIAVTGTHGKTTTTNMLAHVLLSAGAPTVAMAGPTSAQVADGMKRVKDPEAFVLEADEFRNKFQYYSPIGVVLTNVEREHPDIYKTDGQYKKIFKDFIKRIPKTGFLVYCADDKHAADVAKVANCKKIPYRKPKRKIDIPLLGDHNQLNAQGVMLAAQEIGLTKQEIIKALKTFKGSPRRMELVRKSPLIYDDYGHHPTEIQATLGALRKAYPKKKIYTVFQSHTYTRTKQFLKEFGASFKDSDHTIILDIWGSAREKSGTVHAIDLVKEIGKNHGSVIYFPTRKGAAQALNKLVTKKDIILTIGATDIFKIHTLLKF